jgi:hypothetical protein
MVMKSQKARPDPYNFAYNFDPYNFLILAPLILRATFRRNGFDKI